MGQTDRGRAAKAPASDRAAAAGAPDTPAARDPFATAAARARAQRDDDLVSSLLEAAPGLARIGAGAWWRTASWTAGVGLQVGSRLLRVVTLGESAGDLLQDAGSEVRDHARRFLGLETEGDTTPASRNASPGASANGCHPSLRDRGTELLNRSADVTYQEGAHPAYDRILTELAPDEARILRLLATEGAQPAVDVRTGRPLNVGSQLIAPGLAMIGAEAGVRYGDRVPAYLNNLYRLGLIWFSREELDDLQRYQVLEAQPTWWWRRARPAAPAPCAAASS